MKAETRPCQCWTVNELMTNAREYAFQGALANHRPHFWASKLHFYLTDITLYNFPYTFVVTCSALASNGSQEKGPTFAQKYVIYTGYRSNESRGSG